MSVQSIKCFKAKRVVNFGGNIRFKTENYYIPESEKELLDILQEHKNSKIRVVGTKHSWSDVFICEHVIVDMSKFNDFELGDGVATFGAGIQIKHALKKLHRASNYTFPSIGLITGQTIGGAVSTSTHGSGKNSLSHYVQKITFAAYNEQSGEPEIFSINSGEELRAGRCSLGCMGIIVSVKLEVVPQYYLSELKGIFKSIGGVLEMEDQYPLQQTYLIPYYWRYLVHHRQVVDVETYKPGIKLLVYRLYWFIVVDTLLHINIKFINAVSGKSHKLFSWFYDSIFPCFIINPSSLVDVSHRKLVMKHEMFKHFEIELFVKKSNLPATMNLVEDLLKVAAGIQCEISETNVKQLKKVGFYERLSKIKGQHVHHYPMS